MILFRSFVISPLHGIEYLWLLTCRDSYIHLLLQIFMILTCFLGKRDASTVFNTYLLRTANFANSQPVNSQLANSQLANS